MSCYIKVLDFYALGYPGSLVPSQLIISVEADCQQVTLEIIHNGGTISSGLANLLPFGSNPNRYGNGMIKLLINSLNCGDKIEVKATCNNDAKCSSSLVNVIECKGCPYGKLTAIPTNICQGTPPTTDINIKADLILPETIGHTSLDFKLIINDKNNPGILFSKLFSLPANLSKIPISVVHIESFSTLPVSSYQAILTYLNTECAEFILDFDVKCGDSSCCDDVKISYPQPLPCIPSTGGIANVQFSANLLHSYEECSGTGTFEWEVADITTPTQTIIIRPFPLPSTGPDPAIFPYAFSKAGTYRVTVKVKIASACDDSLLKHHVDVLIASCCCPNLTLSPPTVTGCAPDSAVASFVVDKLEWPDGCATLAATSFKWTLDGPTGSKKYQRTTNTPNTDTNTMWTDVAAGKLDTIQFPTGGYYSITVHAVIPGVDSSCDPTDNETFFVPSCPCPPRQHRDSNGNCVDDAPPPPTPMPTPPPPSTGCSIWCILAGIFFIAIPISAHISTVAHCLEGLSIGGIEVDINLQAALIAITIGIFLAICGECCLWIYLIIGAVLGVIATLIAAYWLGFPQCWAPALLILIGYVALGIGLKIDCDRKK